MSQRIPGPGEEMLPLPDFHDDVDLFATNFSARPRRLSVRMILTTLLLLVLLSGVVLLIVRYRTHIVYQTQKATQGDLALTFNSTGSLHTSVYTINFSGSGRLAAVNVSIGQQIKKNAILAKMDPTSLQNALNEAQANVDAAQTILDSANADYRAIQSESSYTPASQGVLSYAAIARRADGIYSGVNTSATAQRVIGAADGGGVGVNTMAPQAVGTSPQQVSTPQSISTQGVNKQVQLTEALGQVKTAQKALALARAQLASAKYNLDNVVLTAPHDGIVAAVNGVVGGQPGTPFIQLTDPSALQLQANVNESNIGAVAVGDAVSFSVDAYPDDAFDGNVVAIAPLSQTIGGKVTYPVLASIVTSVPDTVHLLSGMTADVTTTTDQRTDVIRVPAKALTFAQSALKSSVATDNRSLVNRTQMDDGLARANILLQNLQLNATEKQGKPAVVLERGAYNKIVVTPIVVGLTDGIQYEVLDGLSANDVVLVGAQTSNG